MEVIILVKVLKVGIYIIIINSAFTATKKETTLL